MKVAVEGRMKHLIERELYKYPLKLDRKNPDVVISFGGDGTALFAERKYPGIPKVLIKHSRVCIQCKEHDYRKVLYLLAKRKFKVIKEIKVEGIVNDDPEKRLIGLNEIGVHNQIPRAIRLTVKINGKVAVPNLIGDGLIVSTPFGSSAYFYSVARKKFKRGLGLAFSNTTKKIKSMILDSNAKIEVVVTRGGGWMTADENQKIIELKDGDMIKIKKSSQIARIIVFDHQEKVKFS